MLTSLGLLSCLFFQRYTVSPAHFAKNHKASECLFVLIRFQLPVKASEPDTLVVLHILYFSHI